MKKWLMVILFLVVVPSVFATWAQYGKEEGGHFNNPFSGSSESFYLNDTNVFGMDFFTHPLAFDVDQTADGQLEGVSAQTNSIRLVNLTNGDTIENQATTYTHKGQIASATFNFPGSAVIAFVANNGTDNVFVLYNVSSGGAIDQVDLGSVNVDGSGVRCQTWGSGNNYCVFVDNQYDMGIYRYDLDTLMLSNSSLAEGQRQNDSILYYDDNRVPSSVTISSTDVALIPFVNQSSILKIYAYDVGSDTAFGSFGDGGFVDVGLVSSSSFNVNDVSHPSVISAPVSASETFIALAWEIGAVPRFKVWDTTGTLLNTGTESAGIDGFDSMSQPFLVKCQVDAWGSSPKDAVGAILEYQVSGSFSNWRLHMYSEDGDVYKENIVLEGNPTSSDSLNLVSTADLDGDGTTEFIFGSGTGSTADMKILSCNDNDLNGNEVSEVVWNLTEDDGRYSSVIDDFDQDGEFEVWLSQSGKSLLFDNLEMPVTVPGGGNATPFNSSLLDQCRSPCIFADTFTYGFTLSQAGWSVFNLGELSLDTDSIPVNDRMEFTDLGNLLDISHKLNSSKVSVKLPVVSAEFKVNSFYGDLVEFHVGNTLNGKTAVKLNFDGDTNGIVSSEKTSSGIEETTVCTSCFTDNVNARVKVLMFFNELPLPTANNTVMEAYTFSLSVDGVLKAVNLPFYEQTNTVNNVVFLKGDDTNLKVDDVFVYKGTNFSTDTTNDILFGTVDDDPNAVKCFGSLCMNQNTNGHVGFDCDNHPECCALVDGVAKVDSQLCVLGDFGDTLLEKFKDWILANMFKFILVMALLVFAVPFISKYFL